VTPNIYAMPSEDDEWMASMREQAGLHRPYTAPGRGTTKLSPPEEAAFRQWVATNRVPFNPDDPVADYDMRAYWRDVAARGGAGTAVNPNDHRLHFPDAYKTPYHQSFSAESIYATPQAPHWISGDRLQRPDGKIVFDEPAMVRARSGR
jgi:hypothetical protein